ncbi:suppressor of fused domain protein [Streptomyces sp. 35G-GA-8]|uniref:suppressor of fused domain protein n=1 Tax=Streptomyces sp. 35G-GA-8 TaxID=2939434 RepID=UPI00201E9AE5|nr:suppressor of fused domain protein [Streptomyces sp. 35G-GA-8]MCL7380694.1 suppressor of fused domain protein [Streptomyces sp. 35G-GA-8]
MNDLYSGGRMERYLERLDSLMGARGTLHEIPPQREGVGVVFAATYTDVPAAGYVTGFTYGLSVGDVQSAGRELCISMRSGDIEWAMIPARMVSALWGMCPFRYGQVIGHSRGFVEGSPMNSIIIAGPPDVLSFDSVRLGLAENGEIGSESVIINGAYPIYASERDFVRRSGSDAFWALDWDRFDPLRSPVA